MSARTWKLRMDNARLEELARERWGAHDQLIADGYELGPKSGFWRMSDGTATGRLVYRHRISRLGITALTVTIRGIPLQYV